MRIDARFAGGKVWFPGVIVALNDEPLARAPAEAAPAAAGEDTTAEPQPAEALPEAAESKAEEAEPKAEEAGTQPAGEPEAEAEE